MLKVTSVFNSIQGEGKNIGTPTTFIRLKTEDCFPNKKKCKWCDTIYKSYYQNSIDLNIESYNILNNVCITGGEPFSVDLHDLKELIVYLKNKNKYVEIETNGAYLNRIDRYLFSILNSLDNINISPKLKNSGVNFNYIFTHFNTIIQEFQNKISFKFIYGNENDVKFTNDFYTYLSLHNLYKMITYNKTLQNIIETDSVDHYDKYFTNNQLKVMQIIKEASESKNPLKHIIDNRYDLETGIISEDATKTYLW